MIGQGDYANESSGEVFKAPPPSPVFGSEAAGRGGVGLPAAGDGVMLRRRAPAQARDLREDEPHPLAQLSAVPELSDRRGVLPAFDALRSSVDESASAGGRAA